MPVDSRTRYGTISRMLHWLMAVLIGWQMFRFFDLIDEGEHWVGKTLVAPWHVSIGVVLLVLVVLRIVWATTQRRNRPVQDPATATMVKLGHRLMYLAMLLLPITGMLAMKGGGHPVVLFGVQMAEKGEEVAWMQTVGALHAPIVLALALMVLAHVAIALEHRFLKKDEVMQRML